METHKLHNFSEKSVYRLSHHRHGRDESKPYGYLLKNDIFSTIWIIHSRFIENTSTCNVQLWHTIYCTVALKWEQFHGSKLRACRWKRRGRDCSACVIHIRCLLHGDMRYENDCIVTHFVSYLYTIGCKTGSRWSHNILARRILSSTSWVIRHEIMTCKIIRNVLFHFLDKIPKLFQEIVYWISHKN